MIAKIQVHSTDREMAQSERKVENAEAADEIGSNGDGDDDSKWWTTHICQKYADGLTHSIPLKRHVTLWHVQYDPHFMDEETKPRKTWVMSRGHTLNEPGFTPTSVWTKTPSSETIPSSKTLILHFW